MDNDPSNGRESSQSFAQKLELPAIDARAADFIRLLPPPPLVEFSPVPSKSKQSKANYTLVLDLDETLVHCGLGLRGGHDADHIAVAKGKEFFVRERPHTREFLDFAKT